MSGLCDPRIHLSPGQMSALSGLCPLGHLDLDFLCADQISAGDAETPAGHLLDGRAPVQAVRTYGQPFLLLAAFSGIALSVQPVHGYGQGLMGLSGDGSIGHGSCFKPGDNLLLRLYLLQRDPLFRIPEFHKPPEIPGRILIIDHGGVLPEQLIIPPPDSFLKHVNRGRIIQVLLTAASQLVMAGTVQGQIVAKSQRIKGQRMKSVHLLFNILQGDPTHPAYRIAKISTDNLGSYTDGLKDLGALIGLDGADPHFRSNLHYTVKHRIIIIIYRRIVILIQHMVVNQLPDGLLGQIRVHRAGTVPQQRGKIMHLPGLPGLQNQRHSGTLPGAYQILVQSRYCQQGGNRHMILVHPSVGENQNIGALPVRPVHLHKKPVNGTLQPGIFIIDDRNNLHLKALGLHTLDLQKIRVCQDGVIHPQHITVFRCLPENISLGAYIHGGGGDNLLPDGVYGRIGHLGKKLFEIMKQGMIGFAKHRQWCIHSHSGYGLASVSGHGQNTGLYLVVGIAEGLLHPLSFFLSIFRHPLVGDGQIL